MRSTLIFRGFILVAALLACSGSETGLTSPTTGTAASAIVITPNAPALSIGAQLALQAEVRDATGQVVSGASIFWSSSDTTIVAVSSSGVVTARGLGSAQIAASSGGQSAVVPVSVVPVAVASVALLPSTATVIVGGSVSLQAVAYDASGNTLSGRSVVWASSASQVATVDQSGKVTGVAAGTATISGTSEGKTATAAITVAVIPVAALSVTPASAALTVGQSASLTATATDASGNVLSGRSITWSSSNSAVATISAQGLVKAIGAGTATVTAASEGKSADAQIVVTSPTPVPVASVAVSPSSSTIAIGATATLSATVRDANGATLSGRTVTWSSSAPQIATVSGSGVVTAVASGNATITATSEGRSGSATITIPAPIPPPPAAVATVKVSPATLTIHRNLTGTLTAQLFDASGNTLSGRVISWSTSDNSKVSVTGTGATAALVIHNRGGTVTITATSEGKTGSATITVD
ncbi:MAG TPA: Ig-like domain-containing protein [Gemmatimonadaceae bacterium]